MLFLEKAWVRLHSFSRASGQFARLNILSYKTPTPPRPGPDLRTIIFKNFDRQQPPTLDFIQLFIEDLRSSILFNTVNKCLITPGVSIVRIHYQSFCRSQANVTSRHLQVCAYSYNTPTPHLPISAQEFRRHVCSWDGHYKVPELSGAWI